MKPTLEVLFAPAEFEALRRRDLSQTVCVVFDVLRATTSMLTALDQGAARIHPVNTIPDALALRAKLPTALLAGEREGLRIRAAQTGGIDFDLGNSPREFTPDRVAGRDIIMTTTNGTRALQSCLGAREIIAAGVLNLSVVAKHIAKNSNTHVIIICAGTFEEAAYEDTLAAGALCDLLAEFSPADSAHIARDIYLAAKGNIPAALQHSRNARRLLENPDLRDDVAFCWRRDTLDFVAVLRDGAAQKFA